MKTYNVYIAVDLMSKLVLFSEERGYKLALYEEEDTGTEVEEAVSRALMLCGVSYPTDIKVSKLMSWSYDTNNQYRDVVMFNAYLCTFVPRGVVRTTGGYIWLPFRDTDYRLGTFAPYVNMVMSEALNSTDVNRIEFKGDNDSTVESLADAVSVLASYCSKHVCDMTCRMYGLGCHKKELNTIAHQLQDVSSKRVNKTVHAECLHSELGILGR